MALYDWLKLLHILAAIIAVGANITYSIWYARIGTDRSVAVHTLRTIETLENRLANPAYGAVLVLGIAMAFVGDLWNQPWIHLALGLYAIMLIAALTLYTPALKAQIQAAETDGPESDAYQAAAKKGQSAGMLLFTIVIATLWVMVFKPTLWA